MPYSTILFDHDGTLVDSEATHHQMWTEVLEPLGVSLSSEQYKELYAGIPTSTNAVDMVKRFGLQAPPQQLIDSKDEITHDYLRSNPFPLMTGVRETLHFLQDRGLQAGVVTGAGPEGVAATLRGYNLEPFFKTVVSGDDVKSSKPAPDCYHLAMQRLGVSPAECVAVEDTENGVKAATAAGIACLAIPNAMSDHHNFYPATSVLTSLHEAIQWLTRCLDNQF